MTEEHAQFIVNNIDKWIKSLEELNEIDKYENCRFGLTKEEAIKKLGKNVVTKMELIHHLIWELV